MAVLLFSLRHVGEEEADEVRALLTRHGMDFYETAASNWGISSAALWLRDEARLEEAKALLADYQHQRGTTQREQYRQLQREGRHRTFWQALREESLRVLFYLAVIAVVLYLSLKPFLSLI